MKKLLSFIFVLCSMISYGQQANISFVKDSAYVSARMPSHQGKVFVFKFNAVTPNYILLGDSIKVSIKYIDHRRVVYSGVYINNPESPGEIIFQNISSPADVVMGTVVGYKTSGIFHLRTFATPGELNKICYIDIAVYSSSLQTRYTYKHTIINNCN